MLVNMVRIFDYVLNLSCFLKEYYLDHGISSCSLPCNEKNRLRRKQHTYLPTYPIPFKHNIIK
jgi:hypothetical protein